MSLTNSALPSRACTRRQKTITITVLLLANTDNGRQYYDDKGCLTQLLFTAQLKFSTDVPTFNCQFSVLAILARTGSTGNRSKKRHVLSLQ